MSRAKKSFWTSLPGILTAVAAVVTAFTGLYIAIRNDAAPSIPESKAEGQLEAEPPSPSPAPQNGEFAEIAKLKRDESVAVLEVPPPRERRLRELQALINRPVTIFSDLRNVAVIIDAEGTKSGASPETILYGLLRAEGVNIILNLFREEAFKSRGFFRQIYNGDTGLLEQSGALSDADGLLLGVLTYSFRKGVPVDPNVVSCDLALDYKMFNKKSRVVQASSVAVIGASFSENAALRRGLEMLAELHGEELLGPI